MVALQILQKIKSKLRRWAVVAKIVREYEDFSVLKNIDSKEFRHNEETPQFQKSFKEHYNSLLNDFEKLGNPIFCNSDENDLIQPDTRNAMGQKVIKTIHEIMEIVEIEKLKPYTFILKGL